MPALLCFSLFMQALSHSLGGCEWEHLMKEISRHVLALWCFVFFVVFLQEDSELAFELMIPFLVSVADIANHVFFLFAGKGRVGLS